MTSPAPEPAYRIDVVEAARLIDEHMPTYGSHLVPLEDAEGCILRQTVTAEREQPPYDRVTMDGIAIDSAALAQGLREFKLTGNQAAGEAAMRLPTTDACIEIMTGAVLPIGADTVIPVERIELKADRVILEAGYEATPGQFVHTRGSDHAKGLPLLEPGVRIRAPEMAILTVAGSATVEVAEWPKLAVISTGDELVELGQPLETYQIRSSNDRAIQAAFRARGCHDCIRVHLPDEPQRLLQSIGDLHEQMDVLILSGGVSMGKYDYVPGVLEKLGVQLVFHKVLQRPGLPMWFGVSQMGKPVFALPGNPVSTLVCAVRYALPALLKGMAIRGKFSEYVVLGDAVEFEPDLTWFLPVKLVGDVGKPARALPRPTNTSGDFISLGDSSGFVELPRGQDRYEAGLNVPFYRW